MTQDLDGYKIVVAPMLYMFRAGFEEKVRKFVENGGTFIMTYWSGVVDENDLCVLGGTPGGLMVSWDCAAQKLMHCMIGETNVVKAVVGDVSYQCDAFLPVGRRKDSRAVICIWRRLLCRNSGYDGQ